MKKILFCILVLTSNMAAAQVYFNDAEKYNWRMSDGAKVIISSLDQLIRHPQRCTLGDKNQSLPYADTTIPSIFIHYLQFNPNAKQANISLTMFFDTKGVVDPSDNPNGDGTTNSFGIIYSDTTNDNSYFTTDSVCMPGHVTKFQGKLYGANNWRFRLIKETDLLNALQPYPNSCTYDNHEATFLSNLYINSEAIKAVDIYNDIDVSAGVVQAFLKIPYDDPVQWDFYDNFQSMYGIVVVLKEKKSGQFCNYYVVSNFEGGDIIMKQINTDSIPSYATVANNKYNWQISIAGKRVLDAINSMIMHPKKTSDINDHYSCGNVPIAYLYPTMFDPNCKLINYKFQCDWDSLRQLYPNSFNFNVFAVSNAPCMQPDFQVPCNYSCILNGYSNQVWGLRLIRADSINNFFAREYNILNYDSGNALIATMGLPAIDIYKDIDTTAGIQHYYLDYMHNSSGPAESYYYNYPYNSLGIRLRFKDKKGKDLDCYLISDYDGSATLLWKELAVLK